MFYFSSVSQIMFEKIAHIAPHGSLLSDCSSLEWIVVMHDAGHDMMAINVAL